MRRLAATLLALAALIGTPSASARTIVGTPGADRLSGTIGMDAIHGRGGNDVLEGHAGRDALFAGAGNDVVSAAFDAARDAVSCGAGRDVVNAELADAVAADCEVVVRQLSRDPYQTPDGEHATQVEPDSFSYGRTIVTTFQSGRFPTGGAANVGWATSRDAGRTWRSGFLPSLTLWSVPPGVLDIASDPVVAYDAVHRTWLIATLGRTTEAYEINVSRSPDGIRWSAPVTVVRDFEAGIDKEWITCDSWRTSRFRGRCYVSYLDSTTHRIVTSTSLDGGLTWRRPTASQTAAPDAAVNGAQTVVRPDGTLVVAYAVFGGPQLLDDQMAAVRSTDGGATFGAPIRISSLLYDEPTGIRAPPLPSADVDGGGRLYLTWYDCRFHDDCVPNDVVVSTSADGTRWSEPRPVPTQDPAREIDHFVPAIGIDPTTSRRRARVAVLYHTVPQSCSYAFPACSGGIDVALICSRDGGATWGKPQRLNAVSMVPPWLAATTLGRMLGDYVSVSWAAGRAIPVFSLAVAPAPGGALRQAIFAASVTG